MTSIKVSSKVDEKAWNELRELARESHQNISGLLSEAIREYVVRRRVRWKPTPPASHSAG